jgi:hypothetical protein
MKNRVAARLVLLGLLASGCSDDADSPSGPTGNTTTVRFTYRGATNRRSDLPVSAQACVDGVGPTHMHPSWRGFAAFPLPAIPPDRYEIALNDVRVGVSVSFRVNDQNSCDQNATGAVTRNVFANDVPLVQNTTTPGNGDEPGYAFTVTTAGRITQ